MSDYLALRISRTPADAAVPVSPWVRLEQIIPAKTKKFARLQDLYRAWMYAASGKSASMQRVDGCPVEFEGSLVRFFLGFYAWPSVLDLDYELTTSLEGISFISQAQRVELPREFSAFADNTKVIDLECWMEDVTVEWETPVYDRYGEQITPPEIVNHNTYLELSRECFGALRIAGRAVGDYHILTVEVDKFLWNEPNAPKPEQIQGDKIYVNQLPVNTLNSNRISNIEATVTARWQAVDNTTDTDQLRLEVPQCVLDILDWCPGNPLFILDWCEEVSKSQVFYSTCTGEVVKVCHGLDPQKYCSQVWLQKDPGPWLRGLIE